MPEAFVPVDRATFVLELVAVTAAFGATAPLWSFTSPVMEPEVCASAETTDRHHTNTSREAMRICTPQRSETRFNMGTLQTFPNLSEHNMGRHLVSIGVERHFSPPFAARSRPQHVS